MISPHPRTLLCILFLSSAAHTSALAQRTPVCGGFSLDRVPGWVRNRSTEWLDSTDKEILCDIGTSLESAVRDSGWTPDAADLFWANLVMRMGLCGGGAVDARARVEIGEWSGQPLAVVAKYCADTWDRGRQRVRANLRERSTWARGEMFCEVAPNVGEGGFLDEVVFPKAREDLHELGRSLCAEVRAGTKDVDDAMNEYVRAVIKEPPSFWDTMKSVLAWEMRFLKSTVGLIVTVIGLTATIVGVAVGVKKLLGESS